MNKEKNKGTNEKETKVIVKMDFVIKLRFSKGVCVSILQVGIGEASTAREAQASSTTTTCEVMHEHHQRPHHHHHHHQIVQDHHQHHTHTHNIQQQHHAHHHHQMANAAFHISRPSHPISTIISPPPLHHASIILDEQYNVPRIMLQNENFQVYIYYQL